MTTRGVWIAVGLALGAIGLAKPADAEPGRAIGDGPASMGETAGGLSEPVRAALTLTSEPAGALAMVGLTPVGRTPVTVQVPPGTWSVTLSLPSFEPSSQTVTLVAGRPAQAKAVLRPARRDAASELAKAPPWVLNCRQGQSDPCGVGIASAAHGLLAELQAFDMSLVQLARVTSTMVSSLVAAEMARTGEAGAQGSTGDAQAEQAAGAPSVGKQVSNGVVSAAPKAFWTSPSGTTFANSVAVGRKAPAELRAWGFGDVVTHGADQDQLVASAKVMALLVALQRARIATVGARVKAMVTSYAPSPAGDEYGRAADEEELATDVWTLTSAADDPGPLRVSWKSKGYAATTTGGEGYAAATNDEVAYSTTLAVTWSTGGREYTGELALETRQGAGETARKPELDERVSLTLSVPPARALSTLLEALAGAGFPSVRFSDAHAEKGAPVVTVEISTRAPTAAPEALPGRGTPTP